MRIETRRTIAAIAAAALLASAAWGQSTGDTQRSGGGGGGGGKGHPNQGPLCEAKKLKTTGKYGFCLLKQLSKGVKGSRTPQLKCDTRFTRSWSAAEAGAHGQCPTNGDAAAMEAFVGQYAGDVVAALAGGVLVSCSDALTACNSNLATCNGTLGTCDGDLSACTTNLTLAQSDLDTCNGSLDTCNGDLSTCNTGLSVCDFELALCQGQPIGRPLKTGQTSCSDSSGAVIACTGSGQDGELQKGVARNYVDNDDGTITDTETGLVWEKLSDDDSIHDKDNIYTWASAFTKVSGLNTGAFAGHRDWRLPNHNELDSLVDLGNTDPAVDSAFNTNCAPACTVTTCSCTQSLSYWSSSSLAASANYAWLVEFFFGLGDLEVKSTNGYVRAVRGGS